MTAKIERTEFDVCIIGAGVAGSLLAYSLGENNSQVLLLDAGPRHRLADRFSYMKRHISGEDPWASNIPKRDAFTIGGEVQYPLNQFRVKGVGGTTLHWSAYTPRFHENDFQMRSKYGIAEDWPISYEELEPFYCLAERALGVSGEPSEFEPQRSKPYPMPALPLGYDEAQMVKAGEKIGVAFHPHPQARNSQAYAGRPACATFSTCRTCPIRAKYSADFHAEKAESTGNVSLISNANVVRLEHDHFDRVRGAIVSTGRNTEFRARAKVFVLSANAVESARLLLLSKSNRFPQGFGNNDGLVGKYFMEHMGRFYSGALNEPLYPYRKDFVTTWSRQFYDTPSRAENAAFVIRGRASGPLKPPDVAWKTIMSSGNWGKKLEQELRGKLDEKFGKHFNILTNAEPLPQAKNRVELDDEVVDHLGNPVPKISYYLTDYEKRAFETGWKVTQELFHAMGAETLPGYKIGFGGHQSGTCRMGNDPQKSVVDRNLRVHAVDNLYVLGSSAFVTLGAVNPTLTTAALTLRLAKHLTSGEVAP